MFGIERLGQLVEEILVWKSDVEDEDRNFREIDHE